MKKEIPNRKEIGYRFRHHRTSLGYSHDEYAKVLGVSASTVFNIEAGRKGMAMWLIMALKEKVNLSADYLLFGDK